MMSKSTFARLEKLERAGAERSSGRLLVASDRAEAERLARLHPKACIIITGVAR